MVTMSENATVHASIHQTDAASAKCRDGYVEISRDDYDSIVTAYGDMLTSFSIQDAGMESAHMLLGVNTVFLYMTTDGVCYVAS